MATRADITPELCRQLLRYEPETGKFYWLPRPNNPQWTGRHAGKEALTFVDGHGYRMGRLLNVSVAAHRIAWAISHGAVPAGDIDHINGDRTDNRIANLRAVDRLTNTRNAGVKTNNTSGHIGVTWAATRRKWAAQIGIRGKVIPLGRFERYDDAVLARENAERRYGFHENHGAHNARPRAFQHKPKGSVSTDRTE